MNVNGKPATVMSTDGGAPYRFEALVELDGGANTVVVEARDGRNNVATKRYAVTAAGTAKKYEYDANGNLRYEKLPNGTVVREYRWDQNNRLVRELHGTHQSVYEYDGASRRVRIKELTSGVESKNETFVWCESRICQKRSGSTVVRNYFEQGFEEGTNDYFYTRDHLGSVREVVATNGTTIASRLAYDPWGKSTETGSGAVSDFTYTGHHLDRPTGLSLTRFRAYDARVGRWTSMDPIGFGGGANFYGYVSNDPINRIDPLGLYDDSFDALRDLCKEHKKRNQNNRCPKRENACKDGGFSFDGDKWRSDNGSECTYDKDGNLNPDSNGNFSYNYAGGSNPRPWRGGSISGFLGHLFIDVLPHFLCGGNEGYEPGLSGSY